MNNKELAIALAKAEKEEDVIRILKDNGFWDDNKYWRPYGDNDNNYGTIGNQQSASDAALVEKLVNSVDAVLVKECMIRGIAPDDPHAPKSMAAAMKEFFGVTDGRLANIDSNQRSKLANNIILVATGQKRGQECLTIVDHGEGQTPKKLPETILSIGKKNKLKIPFVQGKFNMGGTGALLFCGDNSLQLVITKKCQEIQNSDNDETFDSWSFSVVRRENARDGNRSTMFTYLTDENNQILSFKCDEMCIVPISSKSDMQEYAPMKYGTYIKLYNYDINPYKTVATLDLNYRLSMLMPELAHPIKIVECRGFTGHSYETTLAGLNTRLANADEGVIDKDFPISFKYKIKETDEELSCMVYLFENGVKSETIKNYRGDNGVFFVMNGQTHAMKKDSFFSSINLTYLAKSLIVTVDCSKISSRSFEDMFMASRDRLRDKQISKDAISGLKDALKDMSILKQKQNERKEAAIKDQLEDDKPLQDVLKNIINNDPVLAQIFNIGAKVKNPFAISKKKEDIKQFVGKKHPTFFRIMNAKGGEYTKDRPLNHSFRIQFETDVSNDYFGRSTEPGDLKIFLNEQPGNELMKSLNLINGIATLTLDMPAEVQPGVQLHFTTKIIDDIIVNDFENKFTINVTEDKEYTGGGDGKRKKPNSDENGNNESEGGITLPSIICINKDRWDDPNLQMNEESALIVIGSESADGKTTDYDYYLNMDNKYYLTELKAHKAEDMELLKAKYTYSMAIVGMSIVSYYKNNQKNIDLLSDDQKTPSVQDATTKISSILAPVMIPMIESLGSLDETQFKNTLKSSDSDVSSDVD